MHENKTEMHSTHNERKSIVAESFNRTLKDKIYKQITAVLKNVYIGKLDEIIDKYNKSYLRTTKMKPVMLSRVPILTMVRISKYKKIFAKGYTPNWFKEVFVIKKVKNAVPWTHVISGLNGEEVAGAF